LSPPTTWKKRRRSTTHCDCTARDVAIAPAQPLQHSPLGVGQPEHGLTVHSRCARAARWSDGGVVTKTSK
jgi:hypothetical protein